MSPARTEAFQRGENLRLADYQAGAPYLRTLARLEGRAFVAHLDVKRGK